MKGKFAFVVGAAVGYVLGTRAGRERYEQIKRGAQTVWNTPPVQRGVAAVTGAVQSKVDEFKASAMRAGKEAFAAFTRAGEEAGAAQSAAKPSAASKDTAAKTAKSSSAGKTSAASGSGSKGGSGSKSTASSKGKSSAAGAKQSAGAASSKAKSAKAKDGDDA